MPNTRQRAATFRRTNVIVESFTVQLAVRYENGRLVAIGIAPHRSLDRSLTLTLDVTDEGSAGVTLRGEPAISHAEKFSSHRTAHEMARYIGRWALRALGIDPATVETP